jgi:uncharacterized protein (DUF4415 family)
MKKAKKVNPTLADKENPNWTKKDFASALRVEDIPALAHLAKRKPGQRGPQKTPTKTPVTLRLDPEVVRYYRDKGPGWQRRINSDLRVAAKLNDQKKAL